jgi:hypothetical protein
VKQKAVLYRVYAGEIQLSTTNKEDTENLQIARRARVLALTASGDITNIEVQIYDSAGEQYTMGFVPVSQLLLGAVPDFRSVAQIAQPQYTFGGPFQAEFIGNIVGSADTVAPHIFEPNIVLDPNQTISIKGRCMHALHDTLVSEVGTPVPQTSTLCFNLHVWEFPIE